MSKVKNFFMKIKPSKRRLIQLYAALLYNANMKGFITGDIFTGKTKSVCLPGMNCYSCPGAVGACPLGSLQNALADTKTKSYQYVLGILLLYCITFGRWICGWLCPGGFFQELLYKIKTPKLKKSKVTRALSYFKYVLLIVLVIMIPLMFGIVSDKTIPGFCKYICPIGTFEGAIFLLGNGNNTSYFQSLGPLFTWKFSLLVIFIVASIFIYRFFCRFFCPLGALYGIFNKLSILGIKVDKTKCNSCGSCVSHCKMDVKQVGDHECIQCGECKAVCHQNAIDWKLIGKKIKEEKNETASADIEADAIKTEEVSSKKSKRNLVNGISAGIMLLVLVGAYVFFNVDWNPSKFVNVNSKVSDLVVELTNDSKYKINSSTNQIVAYFYSSYDKESIKDLIELKEENNLDLLLISSYENKDANSNSIASDFSNLENVYIGYDDENNELIKRFSDDVIYPFYLAINSKNVLLYASSGENQVGILYTILNGLETGKDVGNHIPLISFTEFNKEGDVRKVNANDFYGKLTVYNFWYTNCGPCVHELPFFDEAFKKYSDKINVIAVHAGDQYEENDAKKFISKSSRKDYTITWAYDNKECGFYKSVGGRDAYPMTVITDENGIILYNSPNAFTDFNELEALLLTFMK